MKKLCVILVCAIGLGTFGPVILVAQTKQANVSRLKTEYEKFKEATKCFRQKGWKGCDKAQKKRIVTASAALAGLVIAVVGGVSFALWRTSKRKPVAGDQDEEGGDLAEDQDEDEEPKQVEKVSQNDLDNLLAAIEGNNFDSVKTLIKRDPRLVKVKAEDEGVTPLHVATDQGDEKIVKFLVKSGANVNAIDDEAWTPLHEAVTRGNEKIVRLLVESGANVNAMNDEGVTPLDIAKAKGNENIVRFLEEKKIKPESQKRKRRKRKKKKGQLLPFEVPL